MQTRLRNSRISHRERTESDGKESSIVLRLMQLERQIQTLEQASRQDKDKIERLELQQNEALEDWNTRIWFGN